MHNPITFVTFENDVNKPFTKEEYIRAFLTSYRPSYIEDEVREKVEEYGFDYTAHEEFYHMGEYATEERAREASLNMYENPGVHGISFQEFCQVMKDYLAEKSA